MKLSEEMIASGVAGGVAGHPWAGHVAALEADLADANARAMEMTARCDRMRVAATEANDSAREWKRSCDMATATLHLVYEMREHALRRERDAVYTLHARAVGACKCIGAQICGGLGETHAECEAYEARQQRAYEHGMADGIGCHQGDQRAMHRRAQAAESRAIKAEREAATLRVRLQGAIAKIPPGDLWRTPDPIVTRVGNAVLADLTDPTLLGDLREASHYRRLRDETIPPVALEATSGGNRQAEAAERPLACSECGTRISASVVDAFGGREAPMWDGKAGACVIASDPIEALAKAMALIAERDARIAELTRIGDEAFTEKRVAIRERDAAIARAEAAEATIERLRHALDPRHFATAETYRLVIALLNGKEGAPKPSDDRCPHCFGGWDDSVCGGMECTKCGGSGKQGGRNV